MDYQVPFCIKEFAAKEKLEIVKERGEPRGRAANYGGLLSPPQAAKNVRANLRIVHKPSTKPGLVEEELSTGDGFFVFVLSCII